MSDLVKRLATAAVAMALLAGGAARADEAEMNALRTRLDRAEQRIDDLTRLVGQQPAQVPGPQPMDRDQVVQIVQDQMAKSRRPNALDAYWDKGLHLDSADGAFKLKIGGRVQVDWASMSADQEVENALGPMVDGMELRRVYLTLEGTMYGNAGYKLEVDFGGGKVTFKDVYLVLSNLLPCASIKIGRFKEPFSLEELTTDNYVTFMERALPNAFAPSYQNGVQLSNTFCDDRGTWAAGAFWSTASDGKASVEEGTSLTARATYLPWYENKGERLLHVGAAVSRRSPDTLQYMARPEMHLAPVFLDTGTMMTDAATLVGLEGALVYGPASVQAEVMRAAVERSDGPDVDFSGYYVEASYFLTGEHRAYKNSAGVFDRIVPKNNFDGKGNWGAWQVAARYSHLDLSDQDIAAGQLSDVTLGLNWYLNPNMRIMWNYVRAALDPEDVEGNANAFMMRFQADF